MLEAMILKLKLIFVPCEANHYRPIFLESRFLFYYILVLLILKMITIPYLIYLPKTIFFADITKNALISLTNSEREALGLLPLKENPTLNQAASLKANDIIEKDYFSHQSPEGLSPWYWFQIVGYNYQSAGENLAIGFLDSEEVSQAWLNSPSHRSNLLNPNYREIGIGVAKGDFQGNETTVVVQLFGTPKTIMATTKEPKISPEIPKKEIPPKESFEKEEKEILPSEISLQPKESPSVIREEEPQKTLAFNFFSFILANYTDLLQKIIYGSLIFIIISLIINIFVRIDVQFKDLIFKALAFIVILAIFIFLDKETIIQIIPHSFNIY